MEKSVLDRRIAQMKSEGTRFRTGVDVGARPHRRRPAQALRRGRRRHRRHRAARPAGARARARRRHAGDGLPAAGQPGRARRERRGPGHRRPARTSSSSAAATPAPTASAPRTARARRSVTSLEIMPQPPAERAAHQPWPTYPMTFRVASRARGGRRARVRRVDAARSSATSEGRVAALRLHEVRHGRERLREGRGQRAGDPRPARAARDGLPRPAAGAARPARRRARRAHQRRARRRLHDQRARASSSPATPVAASRSSSGPSPRGGPRRTGSTPG